MKEVKKRGVSPVIATVLLIALVIIIALIIFLFMRNIGEENIMKFGDESIKLACQQKVDFDASYSNGLLAISNLGEAPIFNMNIKFSQGGNYETKELKSFSEWPSSGLNQGGVVSVDISSDISSTGAEKITLIPILVGKTKEGAKKSYTCEASSGVEITI
jgi:flagellin-like protein